MPLDYSSSIAGQIEQIGTIYRVPIKITLEKSSAQEARNAPPETTGILIVTVNTTSGEDGKAGTVLIKNQDNAGSSYSLDDFQHCATGKDIAGEAVKRYFQELQEQAFVSFVRSVGVVRSFVGR
jgi:hypothetical protein